MSSSPSRQTAGRTARSNSTPSDTNNITSDTTSPSTNFTTSNNNSISEGNNNIISIPGTITLDPSQLPADFIDELQRLDAHPSNQRRTLPININNNQRAPKKSTAATSRAPPINNNRAPPRRTPRSRDDFLPPQPSIGGSNNKRRAPKSRDDDTAATSTNKKREQPTSGRKTRTWDENYAELLKFKNSEGHCRVPRNYEQDMVLANWVSNQRKAFKKGDILTPDQISKLQGIGFVFRVGSGSSNNSTSGHSTRTWEENYTELVKFKNSEGHCRVPRNYKQDKVLGSWVSNQRTSNTNGKLTPEQISKLQGIEFVFNTGRSTRTWEENYTELVKFKNSEGHCRVPKNYKQDKVLGSWVSNQRTSNTNGKLTPEQISKLQGIEFDFDTVTSTRTWEENYTELVKFKNSEGHCRVPRNYEQDMVLGSWVHTQRKLHTNSNLPNDRFKKLDKIEFSWASTSESSTQASRVMVEEEEAAAEEQLLASGDDVEQGDTDTVDAEQMVEKVAPTRIHFL